jgi:cbb3-type cytochrome oxidase subunit 1
MVEYGAIAIGLAAVMFFLMEFGMRLQPMTSAKNDPTEKFRLVFIIGSFLMGIPLLGVLIGIASDNGASVAITTGLNAALWGYSAITILATFGMLIYFLYFIPRTVRAAIYDKGGQEEDNE